LAQWALLAGVVGFFFVFLFYPLAYVLKKGLWPQGELTFTFVTTVFANPVVRQSFVNSLFLATTTTCLTFVFCLPLALLASRTRFVGQAALTGLCLVPLVLPPFVGAIGMKQLLARFGSVNLLLMKSGAIDSPIDWLGDARFWGVVILQVLHLYPIMYLNLVASLSGVDPALEEAATNMGSSRWATFRKVTLPLAAPGVFAGAVIVFIWALTDLGTPLVFELQEVLSVQIFSRVTDMEENPEGYALVLWVLLMTASGFVAARYLFGRKRSAQAAKGGISSDRRKLGGASLAGAYILFGGVIFISVLPHLAVVLTSLRDEWFLSVLPQSLTGSHYEAALAHPLAMSSIRNSLFLAGGATMLDALLGVAIAYLLARVEFRGTAVLDAVTMLPLALPGIVVAFGYLGAFGDTFLDARADPTVLLIVAYSVRRLPYMVRSAYAGFSQVDQNLEEASWNLGASSFRTLWRVTLPLVAVSILAGGILAFAFAMLEVSDSLILALREKHYPITKAIYMLLGRLRDGPELACALGVWAMMFLGGALLFAHRILGKRMGDLFKA
jgi:iron(III) transport system permease protein